jgi:DivIVA domain-containing protein
MGILRRQRDGVAEGFTDADSAPGAPMTITPLEIQQKEFGVSRFGGYKMRDVDVFLDQLTDVVTTLMAENERIRGSGSGAHVAIGEPELADVRRQADEMIARAREEATRIVAEARVRAIGVGSSPASGDERAAIEAFLAQERSFLQGLGRLVQDHAESVKAMARTARRRSAVPPEPAPEAATAALGSADAGGPGEARQEAEATKAEEPSEPSAGASRSPAPSTHTARPPARAPEPPAHPTGPPAPAAEPEPAAGAERTQMPAVPAPPDTIRIEDPEPAVSSRRDSGETPRREDSLRELFWGEES